MNMSSPNSWLFSDNARYSTQARLLFMALSFAIGILTFLVYLCVWYLCTRRQRRRRQRQRASGTSSFDAEAPAEDGMSEAAIAALPTFLFTVDHHKHQHRDQERDQDREQDEDEDETRRRECAVCLGQLEAGEKVRRLPKCAHCFHAECVDAWLRGHTTCPMCRAPVAQEEAAAAAATKTTHHQVEVPAPASAAAAAETTIPSSVPAAAAATAAEASLPLPPV